MEGRMAAGLEQGWIHGEGLDGRVEAVTEVATHRGRTERSQGWATATAGAKETVEMAKGTQGHPAPLPPLTLHVEGDEDLGGAGGAAGVADVLARVLLRGAGDDQAAVLHPVLPGQGCPQLRPLDAGRRLAYGAAPVPITVASGHRSRTPFARHRSPSSPYLWPCSAAWRCPQPPR